MSQLTQDFRFAARSLVKQPGFTLAAVLTLALGIGANTAIFSVVDSVLLSPPPFRDPGRVVVTWGVNPDIAKLIGESDLPATAANLFDWQKDSRSFEKLAAVQQYGMTLTGQGEPEQLGAVQVTGDFFSLLGTPALAGRTLTPQDDAQGMTTVVLSYNYWHRRFADDRSVVGKTLVLNGKPLTVVGVMPPRFAFPRGSEVPAILGFTTDPDAWVPRAYTPADRADRGNRVSFIVGRLKPGVSVQAAEEDLNALCKRYAETSPQTDKGYSVRIVPIREQMVRGLRPVLVLLWTAVALVLLIACVNVANLLLARAASRQKEIALRTAIGAGRRRLVGQLLVESSLLSLLGGAVGVFLAWASLRLFAANVPTGLAGAATFALNGRALAFTLGLCVLASLLAGLFPAFQMTRPDLASTLREGMRAGGGTTQSRRTRSALVVAEVAIAVVVLIAAGLLLRSFVRLMDVNPGFRTENVLAFRFDLPADRPPEQLVDFYNRLDQQLAQMPGVQASALVSELPTGGQDNVAPVLIEGKPKPEPGQMLMTSLRMVTPGYIDAMRIPLHKGRFLQPGDTRGKAQVAVIDEAMAKAYWPNEDPLGKRFKRLDGQQDWVTVVGVVGNVRHTDLYSAPRPTLYMTPEHNLGYFVVYQMGAVVRAKGGDPAALTSAVRKAVATVDRNQPIIRILPLQKVVDQSISKSRFSLMLLSFLAVLSLILAVIGIYGITTYTVAQRTREIGLRMALGAQPGSVLGLVVKETGLLALTGIVIGTAVAYWLTRTAATSSYLSSLLYEVKSTDPATFVGVAVVLVLVALAAAYLPGRRATRVSPMIALRTD
jgi:putative ABC transport system permease protein